MDSNYFSEGNENDLIHSYIDWRNKSINLDNSVLSSLHFYFRREQIIRFEQNFDSAYSSIEHLVLEEDNREKARFDYSESDMEHYSPARVGSEDYDPFTYDESPKVPSHEDEFNNVIIGIVNGDQEVYNEIYEECFVAVYKYIKDNSGTLDQAKDIFQEAIIVLLEKAREPNFRLTCTVGTFLHAVTQRLWLNKLRDQKKEMRSTDSFAAGSTEVFIQQEDKDTQPDLAALEIAMQQLGEGCKKLIQYFYYELKKWDNIAESLGYTSPANARNQKYKCIQKLKVLLDRSSRSS